MTTRAPNLCRACSHYRGDGKCAAFPGGIPDDILLFGADHRTPVLGDGGIVFDPKSDSESQQLASDWDLFNQSVSIK